MDVLAEVDGLHLDLDLLRRTRGNLAEEPRHRPAHTGDEASVAGQDEGPGTGVGQAGGLDRLLVEARTGLPGCPPTDRREREAAVERLRRQQPVQQTDPLVHEGVVAQSPAGGHEHCGRSKEEQIPAQMMAALDDVMNPQDLVIDQPLNQVE